MDQATGKSQPGGESGGWLKVLNLAIASRVKREIMKPPPSGRAIARARRQILSQGVRFFVFF